MKLATILRTARCVAFADIRLRYLSLPLAAAVLLLSAATEAGAQQPDPQKLEALDRRLAQLEQKFQAASGIDLPVDGALPGYLHIQSVLLPPAETERIFGKEVASRLAVVRINISNASRSAAFVLKSLAMDYKEWKLAGGCEVSPPPRSEKPASKEAAAQPATPPDGKAASPPAAADTTQDNQKSIPELKAGDVTAKADRCRVASLEVRDARSLAKYGQIYSARNVTDRYLKNAGVVGGALQAVFRHSSGYPRFVAAFTSGVVPAFEDIWKDLSDDQINLLNDVAFRINELVPKESAITVAAFFPIDRFLSTPLQALYQKEPALFFTPAEYLMKPVKGSKQKSLLGPDFFSDLLDRFVFDESAKGELDCNIRQGLLVRTDYQGTADVELARQCPSCWYAGKPESVGTDGRKATDGGDRLNEHRNCALKEMLDGLSLNTVRVTALGEFVADVAAVPANLTNVIFDQDEKNIATFGQAGTVTGKVVGTFLTGGEVRVLNADALNLTFKTIADGSDDSNLKFELTLKQAILPDQSIQFVVAKKSGDRDVVSNTYERKVQYQPLKPVITSAATDLTASIGGTLTIQGTNFYDLPTSQLSVFITFDGTGAPSLLCPITNDKDKTTTNIKVTIPSIVRAGTQTLLVKVGGIASDSVKVTISQ